MTNQELRELRQALDLPIEWCAKHVGRVSARSWQYWETGREGRETPIPQDVQGRMRALSAVVPTVLATATAVTVVEPCVACGQVGRDCLCRFG